jgi:hypothetical protein
MKKSISILFIFLFFSSVFSQKQNLYIQKDVKEMPIFPGCENINPKKKKNMQACITQKLTDLLSQKLIGFESVMVEHQLAKATAEIQFIFSKEGIILGINATENSHPLLANALIKSLNSISDNLPMIRPARLKSGETVNMYYSFPVHYTVNLEKYEPRPYYPSQDIVLFTLKEKDWDYEVRLSKNNTIKVFEYKNNQESFLGRFLSIQEFESSEPYKQLIAQERSSNKTLVTKGILDGESYEIYIYNLFSKKENPYIEVVKLEENVKKTMVVYKKELDFSQSIYAPLIYR